jgi:predicted HTH transcriptional regulator
MNESELLQLIATGECEYIDFKRELNLKNSKQKAEFIKDVVALANSTKPNGYLLIGIDVTR